MKNLNKFSFALCFFLCTNIFASTIVSTYPVEASGQVGQIITVQAIYRYHVLNETDQPRHYRGYEKLTIDNKTWWKHIEFNLMPKERRGADRDVGFIRYKANAKGKFPIESYIEIKGVDSSNAKGSATLTITN